MNVIHSRQTRGGRARANVGNIKSAGGVAAGAAGRGVAAGGVDFYEEPPVFELSIDEFEENALCRLKVRS